MRLRNLGPFYFTTLNLWFVLPTIAISSYDVELRWLCYSIGWQFKDISDDLPF